MSTTLKITANSYVKWDSSRGGSFYRFRCTDSAGQTCVCKMDEKFRSLVEPVFAALDNGEPADLVVIDGGDPGEFRISLDYYRGEATFEPSVEPQALVGTSSVAAPAPVDAMRKITLALPLDEHAYLRDRWKQERQVQPGLTFEAYTRRLFMTLLAPLKVLAS